MSLQAIWRSFSHFYCLLALSLAAITIAGCAPKPTPLPNLWLRATKEDPFAKGQPLLQPIPYVFLSRTGWGRLGNVKLGSSLPATLSPNGKWFLFPDGAEDILYPADPADKKDRCQIRPSDSQEMGSICWLPDSSGWVSLLQVPDSRRGIEAEIKPMNPEQPISRIDLGFPKGSIKGWDGPHCDILEPISQTELLLTTYTFGRPGSDQQAQDLFFVLNPHHKPAITRSYSIYLPKGLYTIGVSLDSAHQKLAWFLSSSHDLEEDHCIR